MSNSIDFRIGDGSNCEIYRKNADGTEIWADLPVLRRKLAALKGKCDYCRGEGITHVPERDNCMYCDGEGEVPLIPELGELIQNPWTWIDHEELYTAAFTAACLEWLLHEGRFVGLGAVVSPTSKIDGLHRIYDSVSGERLSEGVTLHEAVVRATWAVAQEAAHELA